MIRLKLAFALLTLSLTGCSTIQSPSELRVNPYTLGQSDARYGFTAEWRKNQLTAQGISSAEFDFNRYLAGRKDQPK